jgi:hypothetical protein
MQRALLLCSLLAGCSLDRLGIVDDPGRDGGPLFDAGMMMVDDGGADAGNVCVPTGDPSDDCDLIDDDCDEMVDEDCDCEPGTTRVCGECLDGTQLCGADGRFEQACEGASEAVRYYRDNDGDTQGDPTNEMDLCEPMAGWVTDDRDCNDMCATCFEGATEACNGVDDDCDDTIDDGCDCMPGTSQGCGPCGNGTQICGSDGTFGACNGGTTPVRYYRDMDSDGQGDPMTSMDLCTPMVGYVANMTDCDDTCATCYQGGVEVCNGEDDDCDGTPDDNAGTAYYPDADNDNYGAIGSTATSFCTDPGANWGIAPTDCDDTCPTCFPGGTEVCNGEDDNCNGVADDGVSTLYYPDADNDNFGAMGSVGVPRCGDPGDNFATTNNDCNDMCASCFPGGTEVCNGLDDDCDGVPDDGVGMLVYRDMDGDGFGNPAVSMRGCATTPGWVMNNTDCNDSCRLCYPGYPIELCGDGADNDCSGATEGGGAGTCTCRLLNAAGGQYLYCPSGVSWATARTRCMSYGGDLSVHETLAENNAVWTAVDPWTGDAVWIGGTDAATEGTWVWATGARIVMCGPSGCGCPNCDWEPGQPGDGTSGNCLLMADWWDGNWGDWSCGAPQPFICEL